MLEVIFLVDSNSFITNIFLVTSNSLDSSLASYHHYNYYLAVSTTFLSNLDKLDTSGNDWI